MNIISETHAKSVISTVCHCASKENKVICIQSTIIIFILSEDCYLVSQHQAEILLLWSNTANLSFA